MSAEDASDGSLAEVLAPGERAGVGEQFVIEPGLIPPGVLCRVCYRRHLPRRIRVLEARGVESLSTAEDKAVALVVQCPTCATGGALVSRYGPTVSAEEVEVLAGLVAAYCRRASTVA